MALFAHAAIAELSPVSGVKRKLNFELAKGSFWRKAAVRRNAAGDRLLWIAPMVLSSAIIGMDLRVLHEAMVVGIAESEPMATQGAH
jgi:hypothetical protein